MNLSDNTLNTDILFTPTTLGAITIKNRIIMAPMTRLRAIEPGSVPTSLMAEYYAQRATAGLVITEATDISPQAKGYAGSPGIYTDEQITAWNTITEAIHSKGGKCCIQLWHTGRNSHCSLQPGNVAPVAPSAIHSHSRTSLRDADGKVVRVETSQPRALFSEEIPHIIADFRQAVINAKAAGFDLVELHGAHGYLLHQFLSPASNQREDKYGGSIENRARFVLEVVDAAIAAWSADRVGIRLFPSGPFKGIMSSMGSQENDTDIQNDALYLINQLSCRQLAYLHISEPNWTGGTPLTTEFRQQIRRAYPGHIIGAGVYTRDKATEMIAHGYIDAAAFGRAFIANPDLVSILARNAPLAAAKAEYYYGGDETGYTDY